MTETIIYQLTTEDLQNVANEALNRDLTADEIAGIELKIDDYINWHEILHAVINDTIKTSN
jgi:hypothetical protein